MPFTCDRSQIFALLGTVMNDDHFLFHSRSLSREGNDLIITNVSWCLHAPSWGRESWERPDGCSVAQTASFSQTSWLLWWDYLTTWVVLNDRVRVSCLSTVYHHTHIVFSAIWTQRLQLQCWPLFTLLPHNFLLKLQLGRVLMSRSSRAVCPCDIDTNNDPDRDNTGSC